VEENYTWKDGEENDMIRFEVFNNPVQERPDPSDPSRVVFPNSEYCFVFKSQSCPELWVLKVLLSSNFERGCS
jgi:hypothetical protein